MIDYEIIYSKRKTLSLCVKDGRLIVRAPIGAPKDKIDAALESHSDWIEKHVKRQQERKARTENLTDADIAALKKIAKEIIPLKVQYYALKMGAEYGRITITSAKGRFGSCSSTKDLSFSYRLMCYPDAAVDYVVVHELAHTFEMNHSSRFYAIIEKQLPDYKERKKLLKM